MPSENMRDDRNPDNERRSLMNRLITPIVVVVIVVVLIMLITRPGEDGDENGDQARKERPITVELAPVVATTIHDTVYGVGTLNPIQTVHLKPEVNGKLMIADFEEGGFVEKDQVLFEIDDEKIRKQFEARQAALASARIRLRYLQRNFERISSLRERDLVSEEQFDQSKTELESVSSDVQRLEAELELATRQIEDTVLRAPFDGYISRQIVDPGTFVAAGETLAVIYQIDPLQISFFVPEEYAGRVTRKQAVYAQVSAYPDRRLKGKVGFISPSVDEGTRTFRVRANIDNPEHKIMPGSFASAQLVIAEREDRPVIPEQALVMTREGYIVYVVGEDDNTARIQAVEIGTREPGRVEIVDGLSIGEQVVVYGHMQLDDGSPVDISDTWDDKWLDKTGSANRETISPDSAAAFPKTAMIQGG